MHVATLVLPALASAAKIIRQAAQLPTPSIISCSGETTIAIMTTFDSANPAITPTIELSTSAPPTTPSATPIGPPSYCYFIFFFPPLCAPWPTTSASSLLPLCTITTTVTEIPAVDTSSTSTPEVEPSTVSTDSPPPPPPPKPTPTPLAACTAENLIDQVNGQRITRAIAYGGTSYAGIRGMTSPYDCCVACQTTTAGKCVGSVFNNHSGSCQLAMLPGGSACNPNRVAAYFQTGSAAGSEDYVLANGPCGRQQQIPSAVQRGQGRGSR